MHSVVSLKVLKLFWLEESSLEWAVKPCGVFKQHLLVNGSLTKKFHLLLVLVMPSLTFVVLELDGGFLESLLILKMIIRREVQMELVLDMLWEQVHLSAFIHGVQVLY